MAFLYRGAGPGSYWHAHDPFRSGFTPHAPGQTPSIERLIRHIARASVTSPYISFTRSYGVARAYAIVGSTDYARASAPGYVYEIEISGDAGCRVLDPVKEIAQKLPMPWQSPSYQHDGEQAFLLGVVDPEKMQSHLEKYCLFPPGSAGTPRTPHLSEELEGLVRALRDSEVLVEGNVPASLLRNRYEVF